jgi:hypothetical protein
MKRWEARFRGLDGSRCTYVSAAFRADAGPDEVACWRGQTEEEIARKHNPHIAEGATWRLVDWNLEPNHNPHKP